MVIKKSNYYLNLEKFTSPGFSVAAMARKLENVGPGQIKVTFIPVPIFSVLKLSK